MTLLEMHRAKCRVSGRQVWVPSKTDFPAPRPVLDCQVRRNTDRSTYEELLDQPKQFAIVRNVASACEPICIEWISASGRITPDTPEQLRKILKRLEKLRLPIVIQSIGGNLDAALQWGRQFGPINLMSLWVQRSMRDAILIKRAANRPSPMVLMRGHQISAVSNVFPHAHTSSQLERTAWQTFCPELVLIALLSLCPKRGSSSNCVAARRSDFARRAPCDRGQHLIREVAEQDPDLQRAIEQARRIHRGRRKKRKTRTRKPRSAPKRQRGPTPHNSIFIVSRSWSGRNWKRGNADATTGNVRRS